MLYRKKIPFVVIDPAHENTASLIAAGMFTPISGKRKTIHPLVAAQTSFAIEIYQSIEALLGLTFLHLSNIYHAFASDQERAEFLEKTAEENFSKYIIPVVLPLEGIREENGAVEINHSGWVNCALFINSFRSWLQQQELFIKEEFNYSALVYGDKYLRYADYKFEHIIFCEGYDAIKNPFFLGEQLVPCKGDVLSVFCQQLKTDQIVKKNKCYLIPTGDHLYKVGSTYGWHDASVLPTDEAKKEIEDQLSELIGTEYIVMDHKTATRPTTSNREVIATRHQQYKNMFMLNGLGTKGILQGPWWANHLVEEFLNLR